MYARYAPPKHKSSAPAIAAPAPDLNPDRTDVSKKRKRGGKQEVLSTTSNGSFYARYVPAQVNGGGKRPNGIAEQESVMTPKHRLEEMPKPAKLGNENAAGEPDRTFEGKTREKDGHQDFAATRAQTRIPAQEPVRKRKSKKARTTSVDDESDKLGSSEGKDTSKSDTSAARANGAVTEDVAYATMAEGSSKKRPKASGKPSEEINESPNGERKHKKRRNRTENDARSKTTSKGILLEESTQSIPVEEVPVADVKESKNFSKPRKEKKRLANDEVAETTLYSGPQEKSEILEADEKRSKSHSAVLSRFEKSARKRNVEEDAAPDPSRMASEEPEVNELVPIPLPPPEPGYDAAPFNALPAWLAKPVTVAQSASASFEELGLDVETSSKLKDKGYQNALAVQTGVLPLLLPTPKQHPGDVCVSAATGCGKTLSYVLPIVQDLEGNTKNKLRAVIVVPTRELVTQVQQACDICTADTSLQTGTAVGNRALKEEQESLVSRGQRYDPQAAKKLEARRRRQADGEESSDDSDFDDESPFLASLDPKNATLPDHVQHYSSKVDILVTTPGRLVEHLRSTRGFSFKDLQWLVIDEADRLLDQSFQEWADVVHDAVQKRDNTKPPNPFANNPLLAGMFAFQRPPPVRKVILSATMTSDMNKLSALSLRNPKLVLLEGAERSAAKKGAQEQLSAAGVLSLPATLSENAVPVGDGAEKPLYLLALLRRIHGPTLLGAKNSKKSSSTSALTESRIKHLNNGNADPTANPDPDSDSNPSSSDTSSYVSSVASSPSDSSVHTSASRPSTPSSTTSSPYEPTTTTTAPNPPKQSTPTTLIFTSSNESPPRLLHLLTTLLPTLTPLTATLTKTTTSAQTARLLHRLRTGTLRILIASDRASRGLDFPALTDVVSYDVPRSVTDYVHRVGRTARAGGGGTGWTLVEGREAGWFWHVVARGDGEKDNENEKRKAGRGKGSEEAVIRRGEGKSVKKVRLDGVGEDGLRERYKEALAKLESDVRGGERR